jgi:hypothetical protein
MNLIATVPAPVPAATYKPFTCVDVNGAACQECQKRAADGRRCPWCWGGFPA